MIVSSNKITAKIKKVKFCSKTWILLTFFLFSCTDNFEEINTDPNNPTVVPTSYLITGAQRGILNRNFNTAGMLYTQQWSETLFTGGSRYAVTEASFESFYAGPLLDLQHIIDLNTDDKTKDAAAFSGANENQIAICRILKVLIFQMITDIWGEIPYFEALKGSENLSPKYDTQESIYNHFISELTEAAEQINLDGRGMDGDILYYGDMVAWQLFANSLKLRVGIRLTEVNPSLAKETIESALEYGVFSSNADNALYPYLDEANNYNPYYERYLFANNWAISNIMVDYMSAINDPRLPIYADPAVSSNTIVGMPYGVDGVIAASIPDDSVSLPGQAVRQATSKGIIMTYSEVLFIMAEAAQRGWDVGGESAEALYEQAITASMEYWGVDPVDILTYLSNPSVVYDPNNYKKSIGDQKWISLYMNGIESWSEWRRLDYPSLQPAPDAIENREIPRRQAYAQTEYDLNGENVMEAINRQGPDLIETRIWWDK
jgi:hypothetical protein